MQVSKSTVHKLVKAEQIKRHSNAIKSLFNEGSKIKRQRPTMLPQSSGTKQEDEATVKIDFLSQRWRFNDQVYKYRKSAGIPSVVKREEPSGIERNQTIHAHI
ncbi:unnamed protein product [Cuscuta epithymum]|uniref:Uncharacterized protein n=1 Tax=Cuscuta epithymum TaxID=186058 RepID=A0AAV0DZA4_9ASTE|nr:unnamed protein product [Cuscuta epithymum]